MTPDAEPRRYDTAFFVAAVPEGQEADAPDDRGRRGHLVVPGGRVGRVRTAASYSLMPPTQHTLEEIAGYADVADVLAAARSRVVRVPPAGGSTATANLDVVVAGGPPRR